DRRRRKGAQVSAESLNTRVAIQAITPKGPRRVRDSGVKWGSPAVYLVALVMITICIAPVLYIIIGGFRTNSQITLDPSGFPAPWELSNYGDVLGGSQFWVAMVNSTISAVGTTAGAVV